MTRQKSYLLALAFFLPVPGFSQTEQQYINIGLLLPDRSHSHIIQAAELTIEEANRDGAYNNQEFRLLVRTAEGSWGAGSKESVSLVYDDNVRAIVGHLDGRNGHLAEQVATKSHLSYIETFATEPTLSQAFVPWFMRVVPNDNQQSQVILEQIHMEGGGKICMLSMESYDTRYAVRSLTKAIARETGKTPVVISLNPAVPDLKEVIEKIHRTDPDHLIIPFDAPCLGDLTGQLIASMPELKIYGTLHFSMGLERRKDAWELYEGVFMIMPLINTGGQTSLSDSRSAYVYDAVNLVIRAIRQVGTERVAITDYISGSKFPAGATGSISFDELGNRRDAARLFRIKNGVPQLINRP